MSNTSTLTETFTGRVYELPSGRFTSIWKNTTNGLPYKDATELTIIIGALKKKDVETGQYSNALDAIKKAEERAKQPKFPFN